MPASLIWRISPASKPLRLTFAKRIVELAYEDQIYFDYKRWKVADKYIGGNMYGMKITGDMTNPTFSKFLYETRVWSSKWYLFPLYQKDVLTTNGVLAQNPGW